MTEQIARTIIKAQNDFGYFVEHVFSKSKSLFPNGFVGGQYVKDLCAFLQSNERTVRVAPRDHLKSAAFYAHFAWQLLKRWDENIEGHYFSYKQSMAAYHIQKLKQAIQSNPYFDELTDKKQTAGSVISYTWDGEHTISLEPRGLLEFKRGIHAPLIYVDDPFQDPSNKMIITVVQRINDIFTGQILDMAQKELHVCGTPQTKDDFFFDKNIMSRFAVKIQPAIVDETNKIALWPEWRSFEELQKRRLERGEKLFAQEYLCAPVFATEAFINRDALLALVDRSLRNEPLVRKDYDGEVIAGFDIGKKTHPSHLSVFHLKNGSRKQIHQTFMDGWDYNRQVEYLKLAIDSFRIDALYYDNTRGEFEGFAERNELPPEMKPVVFTLKEKNSMAAQLDKAICNKQIYFINDRRQIEQLLMVDNDLNAYETPEGHGDSFWSTALSFKHEACGELEITII